jgi:adenylate cyclase class 2
MQSAEVELKISVSDPATFQHAVERLGFTLVTPRTLEINTLHDTPQRNLRSRKQILRIRTYGSRYLLTHKRTTVTDDPTAPYKTRIETETEIEDPAALSEIFTQLGYPPAFRYEKFRTEWQRDGFHLVLDETPIGTWAELEGEPEWIESVLAALNVPPSDRSTASYGTLFLEWKTRTGSPAENLTFDEISQPTPA